MKEKLHTTNDTFDDEYGEYNSDWEEFDVNEWDYNLFSNNNSEINDSFTDNININNDNAVTNSTCESNDALCAKLFNLCEAPCAKSLYEIC